MRYRYLMDIRRGISPVFANFSCGITILGITQCPPDTLSRDHVTLAVSSSNISSTFLEEMLQRCAEGRQDEKPSMMV